MNIYQLLRAANGVVDPWEMRCSVTACSDDRVGTTSPGKQIETDSDETADEEGLERDWPALSTSILDLVDAYHDSEEPDKSYDSGYVKYALDSLHKSLESSKGDAFLEARSEHGYTLLHFAALYNYGALVSYLVARGIAIDFRPAPLHDGSKPLESTEAQLWTLSPLRMAIEGNCADAVKVLLSLGANWRSKEPVSLLPKLRATSRDPHYSLFRCAVVNDAVDVLAQFVAEGADLGETAELVVPDDNSEDPPSAEDKGALSLLSHAFLLNHLRCVVQLLNLGHLHPREDVSQPSLGDIVIDALRDGMPRLYQGRVVDLVHFWDCIGHKYGYQSAEDFLGLPELYFGKSVIRDESIPVGLIPRHPLSGHGNHSVGH